MPGVSVSADGSLQQAFDVSANTPAANSVLHSSPFIPCAGANNGSSDIPFILAGNAYCYFWEYDANFNPTVQITPAVQSNNRLVPHSTFALSGNQSYIRGTYVWSALNGGYDASNNPGASQRESTAQVIFGTTATPAVLGTGHSVFPGNDVSPLVKRASQLGCVMNVGNNSDTSSPLYGVSADGSSVVDDTARINAFLSLASVSQPVKLTMDGIAAITGVVISPAGNTTIEGLGQGTGFFQFSNISNQDGIRIGPYVNIAADFGDSEGNASNRANLPPRTAARIVLQNFTLGNRGNAAWSQPSGIAAGLTAPPNTPAQGDPYHQTYGIILTNCHHVTVRDVNVNNGNSFSLCLGNINNFTVDNFTTDTTEIFHDGIHINGPAEDGRIANCTVNSGDDGIALNACEGYGGALQRIVVSNCTFNARAAACRIYTSNSVGPILNGLQTTGNAAPAVYARQIAFTNCVGKAQQGFNVGIGPQALNTPAQMKTCRSRTATLSPIKDFFS